jgi:glycosyltransferase involved in cell wall biosynthesis
MKLLFIARTYPPLVGGLEKFAQDFYQNMKEITDIKLIANTIGKKNIIQFFIKVLFFLTFNAKKFDIIHFNDAILSPLIPIIRLFSDAKITFTVHGLDIVYKKFFYQLIVIPFLRKADMIFPVSEYTKKQCEVRGIPREILYVIPNGLDFSNVYKCNQEDLNLIISKFNLDIHRKKTLLTLGRLIKRKGHSWFLKNVFARLPTNYLYIIAGDGPEYQNLKQTIKDLTLEDRVYLLGYVTEKEKACLFKLADLFIMPNIYDIDDQEGFGIVLLEAGAYSLPCIASNIEGIKDVVIEGVSGVLVEEKNIKGFMSAITQTRFNRDQIEKALQKKFSWSRIKKLYMTKFHQLIDAN